MGALHLPPKKPSELQTFVKHLEDALEARIELIGNGLPEPSPFDVLRALHDSVVEARKEMGW